MMFQSLSIFQQKRIFLIVSVPWLIKITETSITDVTKFVISQNDVPELGTSRFNVTVFETSREMMFQSCKLAGGAAYSSLWRFGALVLLFSSP